MSAARKPAAKPRIASAGSIEASQVPHAFNTSNALGMLFRKARDALTDSELKWLAEQASSHAEQASLYAAAVAEGIGCLVLADESKCAAGNFRSSDDVSELLFHFSGVFDQIAGLARLSGDASDLLAERGGE